MDGAGSCRPPESSGRLLLGVATATVSDGPIQPANLRRIRRVALPIKGKDGSGRHPPARTGIAQVKPLPLTNLIGRSIGVGFCTPRCQIEVQKRFRAWQSRNAAVFLDLFEQGNQSLGIEDTFDWNPNWSDARDVGTQSVPTIEPGVIAIDQDAIPIQNRPIARFSVEFKISVSRKTANEIRRSRPCLLYTSDAADD